MTKTERGVVAVALLISSSLLGCGDQKADQKKQRQEACRSLETAADAYADAVKGYRGTDDLPRLVAGTERAHALFGGVLTDALKKADPKFHEVGSSAAEAVHVYKMADTPMLPDVKKAHTTFKSAYEPLEDLCKAK